METQSVRWGLYQWFEEHGPQLIHPADLSALRQLRPDGRVFKCIGQENSHLVLSYGEMCFRVKPALFKEIPPPKWGFGETVEVLDGGKLGEVAEIMWHFQRAEPMYFLSFAGKVSKNRYWAEDLKTAQPFAP